MEDGFERRVVFEHAYEQGSTLRLRIVAVRDKTMPDVDHVLELSEECDAMNVRIWYRPAADEASTNVHRLTTLLALEAEKARAAREGYTVSVEAPKRPAAPVPPHERQKEW